VFSCQPFSVSCHVRREIGNYELPSGKERSFYTLHLYLNDSIAGLTQFNNAENQDGKEHLHDSKPIPEDILVGGATTFYSPDLKYSLDIHPRAGWVLMFQQRGLLRKCCSHLFLFLLACEIFDQHFCERKKRESDVYIY
jgi:hypothetical protein